jgi:hypothetical protein
MALRSSSSSARRAGLAVAAGALLVGAVAAPASAAPGRTDDGTTVANVVVQSAISLTGLTNDFALSGIPGASVVGAGVVDFTVTTNNLAGYAVTVLAQAPVLAPQTAGNNDDIPVGNLAVRSDATDGDFVPVSNVTPVTVHTQDTRSDAGGDDFSNDYRVEVPFVNEDTYSVTLDYVATTL